MPEYQFDKLFTAEEVNDLIPRLEVLLRELQLAARQLRAIVAELSGANRSMVDRDLGDMLERHPEFKQITDRMADLASQVESFGCFLKDIDHGLVDFPFEIEGEVAILCWQYGEPRVIAWHSVEGGFAGRRLLPGAPKTYVN